MANVLMISCNVTREPYPVYPLGMAMVAEAVRDQGHRVIEWDLLSSAPTAERIDERVRLSHPDVIGLSLRNIDSCDSCAPTAYLSPYAEFVRTLRSHTDCPIVVGGPGYSLFPDSLLDRIGADYGVVGEGEAVFCRLVEQLACGSRPQQRVLRGEPLQTDGSFGARTRDAELVSFYLREGGMLNLQTRRGCPYRCAYCTYPTLEGRACRTRSASAVVDEIEILTGKYSADYYAFADSVFNDRDGHFLAVAEELVRRNIRVPWMAFFRPQSLRREDVDLLQRSGLHAVEWGTDCACDTTLDAMRKDFTFSEVEECNRLFTEAGVKCAHFLMFGGPGETEETVREGLNNVERLTNCVVFAFCGVRILPGTGVHDRAIQEGVVAAEDDLLSPRFYFAPDVTRAYLDQTLTSSFEGRRDRIYPPGQGAERVHELHRMGYRGPIWDLLLE